TIITPDLILPLIHSHKPFRGMPAFTAALKLITIVLSLNKDAANGAHVAVIDVEGVALTRRNRAGERTAENDLPGFQLYVIRCEFVRQPGHAVCRMIQHTSGDAGFFNHAIA